MSTFDFRRLPENSECDFEIGQHKYCHEYANYYVWWTDKPGGCLMFCEKHMAEVYQREMGKAMPGYVDKDARIAALEALLAEREQDAEVVEAIGKFLDELPPDEALVLMRNKYTSEIWVDNGFYDDSSGMSRHHLGRGHTLHAALTDAWLIEKGEE